MQGFFVIFNNNIGLSISLILFSLWREW